MTGQEQTPLDPAEVMARHAALPTGRDFDLLNLARALVAELDRLAAALAAAERELAAARERERRVDRVCDWEMSHFGPTLAVERLSCALIGTDDDLTRVLAEHDAALAGEGAADQLCTGCKAETGRWIRHQRACPVVRAEDEAAEGFDR